MFARIVLVARREHERQKWSSLQIRDTLREGLNVKLIPCCAMEILLSGSLGRRAYSWCSTKSARSGNSRICGRPRCECRRSPLDSICQVCFTSTEESQTERHDRGTSDEVLVDQDIDEKGDALEEANREAEQLEHIPLEGYPESEKERLASWLRLLRRARVAIRRLHRNVRHLPREALVQMLRAIHITLTMPPRPFDETDARTRNHHLDLILSIAKWELMCSRPLTRSVCASRS